ncbi:MAG: hypothetical protein ACYCY8_06045 [Burkholderiales bacterium]
MMRYVSVPIIVASFAFFCADCRAAPEEIQVYMDEMDEPGKFGLDLHNNYVLSGSGVPDYPGAVPPVHVYRLTPELSYGLTPSFELGAYFLTAYQQASGITANGEKVRLKFIAPKEPEQTYFWGANLEVGKVSASVDQNPWNAELKGIYGYRTGLWTVAFNANVDWPISGPAPVPATLELDTKVAYAVSEKYKLGFESYNGIGPMSQPGYFFQQSQTLYAVLDTDISGWDLNLGLGRGFSSFSDKLILKAIVGVPFD